MDSEEWRQRTAKFESDHNELPFTESEYEGRLERVQARIRETGLAALLVTTPENIYYLTGHQAACYYTYQALVVPAEGSPAFVIREVDGVNVEAGSWITRRREYSDAHDGEKSVETVAGIVTTGALLEDMGLESDTVGYEANSWFLTHRQLDALEHTTAASLIPTTGIVEAERRVKSPAEIDYIREAAAVSEAATEAGIETVEPGVKESDLAAEVYHTMIRHGGQHVGGQALITSGPRTNLIHNHWSDRRLQPGDPVYFEIPGAVNRYHACLLRTEFVGDPPEQALEVFDVFARALDTAIDTIEPGITAGAVDQRCREIIKEAGYSSLSPHRTGYSLGIAFPPGWGEGHLVSLGPGDQTVLESNMVFHVPRVAFLPDLGAIGLSATLRVTEGGCEVLADLERSFIR
jgi:Xaa-Pro dipeptidase